MAHVRQHRVASQLRTLERGIMAGRQVRHASGIDAAFCVHGAVADQHTEAAAVIRPVRLTFVPSLSV